MKRRQEALPEGADELKCKVYKCKEDRSEWELWVRWRWNHVRFAFIAHDQFLRPLLDQDVTRLILAELVRMAFTYPVLLERIKPRKRGRRAEKPVKPENPPELTRHYVCFLTGIDALNALLSTSEEERGAGLPAPFYWENRGESAILRSYHALARMIDEPNRTRRDTGEFHICYRERFAYVTTLMDVEK